MTLAEFIAEAKHAFRAEGIDPDSPSATAIINNLAMAVAGAEHEQRMDDRARASDLAWSMEVGPTTEAGR